MQRFRVREGARTLVDEWLALLNEQAAAVRETLEPEQMYVETIFSETVDGVDYLYWHTVRGRGGAAVERSEHWLDREHLKFWAACIDEGYAREVLITRVVTMPDRVTDAMRPLRTLSE